MPLKSALNVNISNVLKNRPESTSDRNYQRKY